MASPATHRRAFSLLELLIAVGVLLGLSALILPAVTSGLSTRGFESALDSLSGQMLLARAHAQRTGRAVVLEFDPGGLGGGSSGGSGRGSGRGPGRGPGVTARFFDPERDLKSDGPTASSDQESTLADTEIADRPWRIDVDADQNQIHDSWAEVAIDPRIVVSREPPISDESAADRWEAGPTALQDAESRRAGSSRAIRLAVFMPDGTAAMRTDIWLEDDEQRIASVRVSAWTGQPHLERVTRQSLAEAAEKENETPKTEPGVQESEIEDRAEPRTDAIPRTDEQEVEP